MQDDLTLAQRELFQRIDEILYYVWDPIGVCGVPAARDEYSGYVPLVFKLLMRGATELEVAQYLMNVACDNMGLSKTEDANDAASNLLSFKEWIYENRK